MRSTVPSSDPIHAVWRLTAARVRNVAPEGDDSVCQLGRCPPDCDFACAAGATAIATTAVRSASSAARARGLRKGVCVHGRSSSKPFETWDYPENADRGACSDCVDCTGTALGETLNGDESDIGR